MLSEQILVEKNLVLRLATTAAERAKKTVDKIKFSLLQVICLLVYSFTSGDTPRISR